MLRITTGIKNKRRSYRNGVKVTSIPYVAWKGRRLYYWWFSHFIVPTGLDKQPENVPYRYGWLLPALYWLIGLFFFIYLEFRG